MYSCVSRRVGFVADCQLPQAVEELAEAALSQMISPRIKNPRSIIPCMMEACNGMYGLRPTFAMLMHARPPGTSTRYVSFQTLIKKSRYSFSVRLLSYSL